MERREPFGILCRTDFYAHPGAIPICVSSMVLRRPATCKTACSRYFRVHNRAISQLAALSLIVMAEGRTTVAERTGRPALARRRHADDDALHSHLVKAVLLGTAQLGPRRLEEFSGGAAARGHDAG